LKLVLKLGRNNNNYASLQWLMTWC